jgi:uncharacterized protein (DUF2336 family)
MNDTFTETASDLARAPASANGDLLAAAPPAAAKRARIALIKRLADVVSLPSSRVNAFERAMTCNLLVEMLAEATPDERRRVAMRVSTLTDMPADLAAFLIADDIAIAEILLADTPLPESELIACAHRSSVEHRLAIVRRREVSDPVADAALALREPVVIEAALRNNGLRLSYRALELVVSLSRENRRLCPLILRRPELRPAQAYVMFWWAEPEERKAILQRFAVGRDVLQEVASDVFRVAAEEGWSDPVVRKSLQFVERRQRNRAALEKSPFGSLEEAAAAAETGLTRTIAREIGYLSGVKPATAAKILTDPTGEALAVLCKAAGLKRPSLVSMWRGMRRPEVTSAGEMTPAFSRTLEIFDMMAVDRAQTVLRYWNWSLSSALTPALLQAMRDREDAGEGMSLPERTALLALGHDRKA